MPVHDELVDASGRNRHTVFVILDFLRNADLHWSVVLPCLPNCPAAARRSLYAEPLPRLYRLWLISLAKSPEAVPVSHIRGQDTYDRHAIVQVASQGTLDRV